MKKSDCNWIAPLMLAAALAGCDDTPEINLPPETPAEKAVPSRPTTQELLSGERRSVSLRYVPFSVQAPPSWKVDSLGGSVFLLTGPTPSGEAQIQLSRRPPRTAKQVELLVAGEKKEMAASNGQIRKVEFTERDGFKLLERQSVSPTTADPSKSMISWTLALFVGKGDGFEAFELNVLAMTEKQFEADEPLLRGIFDSLKVESDGGI